jgi:non-histone protein 10
MRSIVQTNNRQAIADGTFDVEGALARAWRELPEPEKQDYQIRIEVAKKQNAEAEKAATPVAPRQAVFDSESRGGSTIATAEDEDVEMRDEGAAEGGFTAVNRE